MKILNSMKEVEGEGGPGEKAGNGKTGRGKGGSPATVTRGALASWPICLGYFPIGVAFGVVAEKAGLTPFEIALMSVIVFAGSAQFIGVSMLAAGAAFPAIIATTFTVNLRHLLMSSALAVRLNLKDRRWIALFGYGVTDESFAVNMARFRSGDWRWQEALVVNHTANLAWVISTAVGGCVGTLIPPGAFGIDYALSAMLISLLVFQLHSRVHILVGVLAGVLSVAGSFLLPGNIHVVAAPVIAAAVGLFIRRSHAFPRKEEPSP